MANAPVVTPMVGNNAEMAASTVTRGEPCHQAKDPSAVARLRDLLVQAVRCSAEEKEMTQALRNWALTDELTGLHSRRGFLALAGQQLKWAHRAGRRVRLVFADLDGLKRINDAFGHREGDQALIKTADILKATFRESDIVARIGGDEFVVLALDRSDRAEAGILARLYENLEKHNAGKTRYTLSLSVGVSRCDPGRGASIEELMLQADKAAYRHKRSKHPAEVREV